MQLEIIDASGAKVKAMNIADEIVAMEFNMPLVHQVVVSYLAGGRAGTRAQKTRGQVSGSTAKPWRQKGTGRARAGTVKSPLWRKGGVIFAISGTQDHSQKVNKKMYRGAMRSILSAMIREQRLQVVEKITLAEAKTKQLASYLAGIAATGKVLLIDSEIEQNLYLAARNLINVEVTDVIGLNPVSLVNADKILITERAMVELGERLQ